MLTFSYCFLCALAALTLAAEAGAVRAVPRWLAGFVAGVPLFVATQGPLPIAVEAEQGALMIALMAVFLLRSRGTTLSFIPIGGLLAALWAVALQMQGFPPVLAWLVVAATLITAFRYGNKHATFCTPALREEALVVMVVIGAAIAVIPGTVDGWHAGLTIAAADETPAAAADATSALAMTVIFFLCGTVRAVFKYHFKKVESL